MRPKPARFIEEHYTAAEAGKLLKLGRRTILDLVRRGEFPHAAKPFPNKLIIPASDIEAWLARHRPHVEKGVHAA